MTDIEVMPGKPDRPDGDLPLVDGQLADELLARVQAQGVELLGPDGLLTQVTKAVLERALGEEWTGHLGYDKHDPAGRGSGNSCNGSYPKTVLTDIGAVDVAVPRDRTGSFSPQIVRKGQTRLEGFNDRIIALYARGMTTRDIRSHLREMYDVEVSPDLISRVTDAIVEELAEWQARPLDRVYPVIFIDALMVKIRDGVVANRPVYVAIGIDCDGAKNVLGMWVRCGDRGVEQVLAHRAVRAQVPRGGRCVHRLLRRADRPARRDHCGLAAGCHLAVRGASNPRLVAICVQEGLGPADQGPAADLYRRRPNRRRVWVRGVRTALERTLPGDCAAVACALGRVHSIPGVPARGKAGHRYDESDRVDQRQTAESDP
jgi:hypothetical protein